MLEITAIVFLMCLAISIYDGVSTGDWNTLVEMLIICGFIMVGGLWARLSVPS